MRSGKAAAGLAGALVALAFGADGAAGAATTFTFNEGQVQFGGSSEPMQIVSPGAPVRMEAELNGGHFIVQDEDFHFPPVTIPAGPGQQATIEIAPENFLSGDYDQSAGQLDFSLGQYNLHAELSSGATCDLERIPLAPSTTETQPFAGDPFDPASLPPANGAVAARWNDLPSASGLDCFTFNQLTGGAGGIRLANSSAATEGGELTAKANKKTLVYGDEATIKGKLSDVPSGNGGHQVELIERPFPYEEASTRVRREITKADGSYAFKVKPGFNTKYVVRDAGGSGAQSKPVQVWVYEDGKMDSRVFHRTQLRARISFTFGRGLETDFTKRQMLWYFRKKGSRSITLMDKTPIRQKPGKYFSKASYRVPDSRETYRFFTFTCFDEPRGDDGTGKPDRYKCPRKKHPTYGDFRRG